LGWRDGRCDFCLPDPLAGDGGGRSPGPDPGIWHRDDGSVQGSEDRVSRGQ